MLVPAQVAAAELAGFVRHAFKARNIDGLWLAIPHKAAMVGLLDQCDRAGPHRRSGQRGAALPDGSLEGALFDGVGFAKALDHFGIAMRGRNALVVGVGGGGVAVATSLAARGVGRIALFDTTPGRTAVAPRLGAEFGVEAGASRRPTRLASTWSSTRRRSGLKRRRPAALRRGPAHADTAVVDILMKNQPTPLLRACQARGITAHPGFEMMVQQVPEYLSFFGFDEHRAGGAGRCQRVRALFEAS